MNERVGALNDLKVIDLTRVLGGPYCTQILGDQGAEIIKVEPPQGDETRAWGPPFRDGDASYFVGVNRNKKSISIDLRKFPGRNILLRMLEGADILIENYKGGTMNRWGLGYEEFLKEKYPRLIHLHISGFGDDGPFGGLPGYDGIVQAMTGMMSVNGIPGQETSRMGVPMVDLGTGLYSVVALLSALHERNKSGLGQYIDMALYDCAISLMHPHVANYVMSGDVPGPLGNQHSNLAPYDKFKTRTGDIFLGVGNDNAFLILCDTLGKPELAVDDRFISNPDRVKNREILSVELEKLLADRDGHEISRTLLEAGVACGPVQDTAQVMSSELTAHRNMAISEGAYQGAGNPVKLMRTPGEMQSVPPKFGEHTREILESLNYNEAQIDKLIKEHIVALTQRK